MTDERGIPLELYEGPESGFSKPWIFRNKHFVILGKREYLPDQIRRVPASARSRGEVIADYRPEFAQYEPAEVECKLTPDGIIARIDNWSECGWSESDHEGQRLFFARFLFGSVESIWRDLDALRRTCGGLSDVPECPVSRGDAATATETDYLNALRLARRWCGDSIKAERQDVDEPPNVGAPINSEGDGTASTAGAQRGAEAFLKLGKVIQLAYWSFQAIESNSGRKLEDREAYDILTENELPTDKGDLGGLADYEPPAFGTWARYLRDARKAMGESKYAKRSGRRHGKSIATPDEI